MNTEQMDAVNWKVLNYSEQMTADQWETHVAEEYPNYCLASRDDVINDSYTEEFMLRLGFDHTAKTIWITYADGIDPGYALKPQQQYMVTGDLGNMGDFREHIIAMVNSVSYMALEYWTVNPVYTSSQALLIKKPIVCVYVFNVILLRVRVPMCVCLSVCFLLLPSFLLPSPSVPTHVPICHVYLSR